MSRNRKSIEDILARVNFPLYTVQLLTPRHVIVGGGGGTSKTGVANGFVSYVKSLKLFFNLRILGNI